jgi:hypothetical protein
MYQVEDEPIETIHLYVYREEAPRPQLLPIALSTLVLLAVIAVGVLIPYQQPEIRTTLRIPALLMPLKTFTASIAVIPTGSKIIPATEGQGVLTIYNGSIIAQELPQGLIVIGKDSTEVVTQYSVTVPPGNPPSFGVASVRARTVTSGERGNIQAYDINEVYGSSLYIRNLHPFTGGKDAQTISFITSQDRQHALTQARATLTGWTLSGLLYRPCAEQVSGTTSIQVRWTCQFVSYTVPHLPGVKVLRVSVVGGTIILEVSFTPRQRVFTGK